VDLRLCRQLEIPLWPSFIASATFYAAGGGMTGLPGETLAAVMSMLLGAVIGLTTERLSQSLAPDESL
jgi:hypothetical protein